MEKGTTSNPYYCFDTLLFFPDILKGKVILEKQTSLWLKEFKYIQEEQCDTVVWGVSLIESKGPTSITTAATLRRSSLPLWRQRPCNTLEGDGAHLTDSPGANSVLWATTKVFKRRKKKINNPWTLSALCMQKRCQNKRTFIDQLLLNWSQPSQLNHL